MHQSRLAEDRECSKNDRLPKIITLKRKNDSHPEVVAILDDESDGDD